MLNQKNHGLIPEELSRNNTQVTITVAKRKETPLSDGTPETANNREEEQ